MKSKHKFAALSHVQAECLSRQLGVVFHKNPDRWVWRWLPPDRRNEVGRALRSLAASR